MLINKITTGFVIQTFNTETQRYTEQHFVAGDTVDYEFSDGTATNWEELGKLGFGPYAGAEPYLAFDMKQPK